jgi:hypothetical protein
LAANEHTKNMASWEQKKSLQFAKVWSYFFTGQIFGSRHLRTQLRMELLKVCLH